jgi:hypothetical protein
MRLVVSWSYLQSVPLSNHRIPWWQFWKRFRRRPRVRQWARDSISIPYPCGGILYENDCILMPIIAHLLKKFQKSPVCFTLEPCGPGMVPLHSQHTKNLPPDQQPPDPSTIP